MCKVALINMQVHETHAGRSARCQQSVTAGRCWCQTWGCCQCACTICLHSQHAQTKTARGHSVCDVAAETSSSLAHACYTKSLRCRLAEAYIAACSVQQPALPRTKSKVTSGRLKTRAPAHFAVGLWSSVQEWVCLSLKHKASLKHSAPTAAHSRAQQSTAARLSTNVPAARAHCMYSRRFLKLGNQRFKAWFTTGALSTAPSTAPADAARITTVRASFCLLAAIQAYQIYATA